MKRYIISLVLLLFSAVLFAGNETPDSLINRNWQKKMAYKSLTGYGAEVYESDLDHSSMTDMRNRLTGLIPGLEVVEINGYEMATSTGSYELSDSKVGMIFRRNYPYCIVDGIPVPYFQLNLQPNQIESITLLADVADKAAYGPVASDGALLITTKKGQYNTPFTVKAEVESGVAAPQCIPEWVNGVEYLTLNNLARANSGMTQLYTAEDIEGYSHGNAYDMTYPNVDYKAEMMRKFAPQSRMALNFNGGSSIIKYNMSLNCSNQNDIYKLGPKGDINEANLSTSVTAKVGRWLEANVSFIGAIGFQRMKRINFGDYHNTPATAFPLTLSVSEESDYYDPELMNNITVYGTSRNFQTNYYAQLIECGYHTNKTRSGMFNATLDFDLGWLVKGLKSKTFVNLNTYYYYGYEKSSDYLSYYWIPGGLDGVTHHTGSSISGRTPYSSFTYQSLNMYQNLSYSHKWGDSTLDAEGVFFLSDAAHAGNTYYLRQVNTIGDAHYSYKGKYNVDLVAQYAGTSRYNRANRFQIFPALGLSWVVSDEDFLKNSKVVDYLKVRLQIGKDGDVDVFGTNYLYNAQYSMYSSVSFGPGSSTPWFGSNTSTEMVTTLTRRENPDLTWTKSNELDFGIDARFWNSLNFTLNGFYIQEYDVLVNLADNYARSMGDMVPIFGNHDAYDTYGIETGLNWTQSFGDFKLTAGGTATSYKTMIRIFNNDLSTMKYNKIVGEELGTYRGLKCTGIFQSEEEIASSPLYSAQTQVGDLKYEDFNDDGVIDIYDYTNLPSTVPHLRYSLYFDLNYKNFGFYVLGSGRAFYVQALTTDYFWNGWGDGNYSAFVRDNIGGDYPSLGYTMNPNNFTRSDFWLKKSGYFTIQTVDLSYSLTLSPKSKIDAIQFDLRGGNLYTFTKMKYVNPESITAGTDTYPLFTSVTLGAKIIF